MSDRKRDLGEVLKSVGDSYIDANPADFSKVRDGIAAKRRRRAFIFGAEAIAVTAAIAAVFVFAVDRPERDGGLAPAEGETVTLEVTTTVRTATQPDQVTASGEDAYVSEGAAGTIERFTVGTPAAVRKSNIGGRPDEIVTRGDGVWVVDTSGARLVELSSKNLRMLDSIDLREYGSPTRLEVSEVHLRVVTDAGIVRVHAGTKEEVLIYEGAVVDIALAAEEGILWVLGADGTVFGIDPMSGQPIDGIDSTRGFGGDAGEITYLRGGLWHGHPGEDELTRIDAATGKITHEVDLPGPYRDIEGNQDGLWLLTRDGDAGELLELDPMTGSEELRRIALEGGPNDLSTGGEGVWVVLQEAAEVIHVR